MTWYGISALIAFRTDEQGQKDIPVFENFYLIEAASLEEAEEKGIACAMEEVNAGSDGTVGGVAAKAEFLCLRKAYMIANAFPYSDQDLPQSGAEVSHCYFQVANTSDLEKLRAGKPVHVFFHEDMSEE